MGAGLALAAELAHGVLALSIRWEAAAMHALALGLGAWAAHRRLAALSQALRGSARARAAIFAYGSLLVLWGWRPLLPETDMTAIGAQLTCIFVNNGVLRAREAEVVREVFGKHFRLKLQYEEATKLFLLRLKASPTRNASARSSAGRSSKFSRRRRSGRARRSSSRKARFTRT